MSDKPVRELRPVGLGARGAALWRAVAVAGQPAPRAVLLGEACRMADRLDKLDALLTGDADVWSALVHNLATEDYTLVIDGAASEARQTASALRMIIAQLSAAQSESTAGGTIADELARRRADRGTGSAG